MFLMFSLLASGCVSNTGHITKHTTSLTYTESLNISQYTKNTSKLNITDINSIHKPIRKQHGYKPKEPEAQKTQYHPSATHSPSKEKVHTSAKQCDAKCPPCSTLDAKNCKCSTVLFCDGNGICEEGEYPHSKDCPDCDDGDNLTQDIFNYTSKKCIHIPQVPDRKPKENESTSKAALIITEIMYDSLERYDQHGEFIEIYNPTGMTVNLEGWKIRDSKREDNLTSATGNYILAPKQHALVTGTNFTINIPENTLHLLTGHKVICSHGLSNKGENITLLYKDSTPIDSIDYSTLPKCKPGHSLERKNNNWSCSIQEGGTPGY